MHGFIYGIEEARAGGTKKLLSNRC